MTNVDWLRLPETKASIALCACPGLEQPLVTDLEALRDQGARGLVTLVEERELSMLGVHSLRQCVEALGMRWWHLPVRDMQTPDPHFEKLWTNAGRELREMLAHGSSFAVHCRGGLGRTGMIVARLLVELGSEPQAAIERVRRVRPGAIETRDQEAFVYACRAIC